ncbi:PQQ-dependent dehydrogenase, methanol/ethanol family [Croceicoccus sp. BE223]|uniref:PQQ-dependent dehydrogenase, methanol/ethanol family n=1 Tax=Croceicoccus sp. BE223 TaxID=2817716 RepID=UPI0028575863|nr:PQQ-dependent dehydrogenase, methanol/ethanol family [Croceicoccus sp. BE223]MDR7101085.1 alcohol dehydrogenase (cytochrome c)/quinohemoprotein ethanol dehydrogenase [Croceicoccus sp. BE223]
MTRRHPTVLPIIAAALLGACGTYAGTDTPPGSAASPVSAPVAAQDWAMHGGTADEQRYSPLDQINAGNVAGLKLAWYQDFDTARGQEATPLVVDGVLYTSTAWSKVYAFDAATGRTLWQYDPQVPGKAAVNACCDVVNRGVAYSKGRIFVGTLDGRLVALDAKTGKPDWITQTTDTTKPYTITGAPRVARGKVFIGNGGADFGVRGYVSAYDEETGKLAWRFYTVPGKPGAKDGAASDDILSRLAAPTWFGDKYLELGGGGTVWDAIVYDEDLNQLYIGVGNGSPLTLKERSEGKGDNLFLSSIVALDPDTGRYLWHYQEVPGETWDFTATAQITLATLNIGGMPRQVLMHAPKNGFFYVIDRKTGTLISAEKFAPVNWAERIDLATGRPVEAPGARYESEAFLATSAGAGAHSWQPMSYSPKTGLVYLPTQMIAALYNHEKGFRIEPGQWNLGYDMMTSRMPGDPAVQAQIRASLTGWLSAWDPVAQKEVWRGQHGGPWNGGTLATAGDLVFQGTAAGTFDAYRASDGQKLWSFAAQSGVMAGPVSFQVGGRQYIAVLAGYGGAVPLSLPSFDGPTVPINGRVLVFSLDGMASLPPKSDAAPPPIVAPTFAMSAERVEEGRLLFGKVCAACHGLEAWSGGIVPDLRRSGALHDAQVWQDIVIGGALQDNGMVGFAKTLTPSQAESIRHFVGDQARTLAGRGAKKP